MSCNENSSKNQVLHNQENFACELSFDVYDCNYISLAMRLDCDSNF